MDGPSAEEPPGRSKVRSSIVELARADVLGSQVGLQSIDSRISLQQGLPQQVVQLQRVVQGVFGRIGIISLLPPGDFSGQIHQPFEGCHSRMCATRMG